MTSPQREIARSRAEINTATYSGILSWFIQKSGHSGYKEATIPDKIPEPKLIEDKGTADNTYKAVNDGVKNRDCGGTYYFASTQDPKAGSACYDTESDFALAMMNRTAPSLVAVGRNYAKAHEMDVENVLPFAFPWGIGGQNIDRKNCCVYRSLYPEICLDCNASVNEG